MTEQVSCYFLLFILFIVISSIKYEIASAKPSSPGSRFDYRLWAFLPVPAAFMQVSSGSLLFCPHANSWFNYPHLPLGECMRVRGALS